MGILGRLGLVLLLFARSLRAQRKRAILTVVAIAWGSLSLLLLLGVGEGMRNETLRSRATIGVDIGITWPGLTTKPWAGLPAGRRIAVKADDIELLRGAVPGVRAVAGEIHKHTPATRGTKSVNLRVVGVHASYGAMRNLPAAAGGRWLNPVDEQRSRRVVFLGDAAAKSLFGDVDPLGRDVMLFGSEFMVVGVLEPKNQGSSYMGPDKQQVFVPITTLAAQLGHEQLNDYVIQPETPEQMPAVLRGATEVLAQRYKFDPNDKGVLSTWDTVESTRRAAELLLSLELFFGVMGALTLAVAGVGVANIMYAVVRERTGEIAVKMALGARRSWIIGPLVLEALGYALVGGALGFLLAASAIAAHGALLTEEIRGLAALGKPTLSLPIAAATAGVLALIGLAAGYFPARRAASIQPAVALREE